MSGLQNFYLLHPLSDVSPLIIIFHHKSLLYSHLSQCSNTLSDSRRLLLSLLLVQAVSLPSHNSARNGDAAAFIAVALYAFGLADTSTVRLNDRAYRRRGGRARAVAIDQCMA